MLMRPRVNGGDATDAAFGKWIGWVAMALLFVYLAPSVAKKMWWATTPPALSGVMTALYYHDPAFVGWGILVSAAISLICSVIYTTSLNGTGWIPPGWFIAMVSRGHK